MRFQIVTLFPEFFSSPLSVGLVSKALGSGAVELLTVDPRQFTQDRHRTVDDAPYGGGAGMVMKPDPLVAAIRHARAQGPGPVVLLTPQGRPLEQQDFEAWALEPGLILVAGRYEGFDERVRAHVDLERSLGDYVLTGGEYGALVVLDGVIRLLPGTVGNASSVALDSFSQGLLEHPHFTRPVDFEGVGVPEVLLSGHHEKIEEWRLLESLDRTRRRRPDLLAGRPLGERERRLLRKTGSALPPVELGLRLSEGARGEAELLEALALAQAYGARALSVIGAAPALELPQGLPELRFFPDQEALLAHARSGSQGLLAVGCPGFGSLEEAAWPERVLGPRALLRKALGAGAALLFSSGMGEGLDHWLPSPRPLGGPPPSLVSPRVASLAVHLDRCLSEG